MNFLPFLARLTRILSALFTSGPIATALTFLLGELAQSPEQIDKLYEELRDVDPSDIEALNRLPHLDACLTETLRLWPGLLTGGARKTGENGVWIAGRFIPPQTTIVAPQYVIARRKCEITPPPTIFPLSIVHAAHAC